MHSSENTKQVMTMSRKIGLFLSFLFLAVMLFVNFYLSPLGQPSLAHAARIQPGGKLRVATKMLPPFVFKQEGELVGFSIDLWKAIAQELEIEYEWVEMETVSQMLEAIENQQADVAIAGISMTEEREARIDFTLPTFNSGLLILIPAAGNNSLTALSQTILSPSLFRILGIGLLILLAMAHVIWLVERKSNQSMPRAYLAGIWEALWWSLKVVASSIYNEGENPRSILKRLLAMFWIVLGIILIAQFTASVTASLTIRQFAGIIRGPSELPGKRISTVTGTTSAKFLEQEGLSYVGVTRIEEAYELLNNGEVQAVVFDAPVLIYYAMNEGRGKSHVTGQIFNEEYYGIALPSGSELREPIDEVLLRLHQNGTYAKIYKDWFGTQQE